MSYYSLITASNLHIQNYHIKIITVTLFRKNTDYFTYEISVSKFFIIIFSKSYPWLFSLLTHRLAYPNSEFPS